MNRKESTAWFKRVFIGFAVLHGSLLAYQAVCYSPTLNEKSHLAAGLSHLKFHRFDLFRVNPPLVRTWAAIPVTLLPHQEDWRPYSLVPTQRSEADCGNAFANCNGPWYFWLTTFARWMCIPFSLLGGWVCGRWAMQLYGLPSGILAMLLWFFSPMILAHASLITADAHSAALGVTTMYCVWKWLSNSNDSSVFWTGIVLGVAQLSKHTLLVLYPSIFLLWCLHSIGNRKQQHAKFRHLAVIILLSLFVLNLGYLFTGTFKGLKEHRFRSCLFTGLEREEIPRSGAPSRFEGLFIEHVAVPLPSDYLQGIDAQKADFECGVSRSYLCGTWRERGWWYWYLCAFLFKTPVATLALLAIALAMSHFCRWANADWRDEAMVLVPLMAVVVLVSSQIGFTVHYRYVLPALPFLFIWMSKSAQAFGSHRRKLAVIVACLALCIVVESLSVFPHSLSFFNCAVGGPHHGHRYLLNSNIAWGQDLHYLRRRVASLGARPCYVIEPNGMTNDALWNPPFDSMPHHTNEIKPGWYAVSINTLYQDYEAEQARNRFLQSFQRIEPAAMAGFSFNIYHITEEDVIRIRSEVRLPELLEQDVKADGS